MNLEELLKEYGFAQRSRKLFRTKRIWVDDLPEDMTKAGMKAYGKLISLLYEIAKLTGELKAVNEIVSALDAITAEQY